MQLTVYYPNMPQALCGWGALKKNRKQFKTGIRLLSRAAFGANPNGFFEQRVCELLGCSIHNELPVAALLAREDQKFWLCAQPMAVSKTLTDIVVLPIRDFGLSESEIREMEQLIYPLLAEYHITMQWHDYQGWLLAVPERPAISTTPPSAMFKQSLFPFLPKGVSQLFWQRLLTEIQMVLHQCSINIKRNTQGKPSVDCLWFWGGGVVALEQDWEWDVVISNDPLVRALSQSLQIKTVALDRPIDIILAALQEDARVLCISTQWLDQLGVAHFEPEQLITELEQQWMHHFAKLLRDLQLTQLTVYFDEAPSLHWTPKQMRKWWCRNHWQEVFT